MIQAPPPIKVRSLSDHTPASHSTTLHPLLHFPSRADASSPCGSVLRLSSTLSVFLPLSTASLAGRGGSRGGGAFSPTTASFFLCLAFFCRHRTCVSFCPQRRCARLGCAVTVQLEEDRQDGSKFFLSVFFSLLTAALSCGQTRSAVRASLKGNPLKCPV